jgi:CelD/BcsL family acetyltransferase involved in cellulose biosynthesis
MTVHPAFPADAAPADPLTVRVVDPLALSTELAAAWDRLAAEASEPNPFAERWCLQSALIAPRGWLWCATAATGR